MNTVTLKAIGLVSGGVAVGSTCTYFIAGRHFKKKYEAFADEEIAQVKKTYALLRKEGEFADPATAVEAYKDRVTELEYAAEASILEAQEGAIEEQIQEQAEQKKSVVRNIFDEDVARSIEESLNSSSSFEQAMSIREAERRDERDPDAFDALATRDPESPFHIPKNDFFDDSNEFDKLTITYYEGDDTLTDERDVPIRDIEGTVGRGNMSRFGQASEDANIVYIRNERLRTDFEVVRDPEEYTTVILGIKQDTDTPNRIRRMRNDE